MKPALTKKEWLEGGAEMGRCAIKWYGYGSGTELQVSGSLGRDDWVHIPDELMHKAAALCLRNQEFGFTREHVETLRVAVAECKAYATAYNHKPEHEAETQRQLYRLRNLSDLIEALLPPEKNEHTLAQPAREE